MVLQKRPCTSVYDVANGSHKLQLHDQAFEGVVSVVVSSLLCLVTSHNNGKLVQWYWRHRALRAAFETSNVVSNHTIAIHALKLGDQA
jgi:hypothetical protein